MRNFFIRAEREKLIEDYYAIPSATISSYSLIIVWSIIIIALCVGGLVTGWSTIPKNAEQQKLPVTQEHRVYCDCDK